MTINIPYYLEHIINKAVLIRLGILATFFTLFFIGCAYYGVDVGGWSLI